MCEKDDGKIVNTFIARRAHQRKVAGEELYEIGTIMDSADRISRVYGELALGMGTEDLLVSIFLAERALFAVLVKALGEGRIDAVRKQAVLRAVHEFKLDHSAVPDCTVFNKDRDDDEV